MQSVLLAPNLYFFEATAQLAPQEQCISQLRALYRARDGGELRLIHHRSGSGACSNIPTRRHDLSKVDTKEGTDLFSALGKHLTR
jgi:hypothetical protein